MANRQGLSKGEMEVAHALWQLGKATVRDVFEAIPTQRKMDFTTVQTYLRRLEAKGYVEGGLEGRIRVYTAKRKPRTVIRETVEDLIDRLFGGETLPLIRHLIEERDITHEELGELRQLLQKLEKESPKS